MTKCLTIAAIMFTAASSAVAQGTLIASNFVNSGNNGRVDSPVYFADGVSGVLGDNYTVQILAGADAASMSVVAEYSFFPTTVTAAAGYWNAPAGAARTAVVDGVAGGGEASVQVVVWDSSLGDLAAAQLAGTANSWGQSEVFSVTLGTEDAPPPALPAVPLAMVNMPSFNLVPEPTTIALGLMGLGLVALRLRKK